MREQAWTAVEFSKIVEDAAFGPRFSGEQYADDGNVATLRTTDLSSDGRISYGTMPLANLDEARFASHFLIPGDIVISRSGRIGTTAYFEHHPVPVLPGAFLLRFRLRKEARPRFYTYWFNSPVGQSRIMSVARGAAQQNINLTNVLKLSVPLPPTTVQDRITEILSAYDDLIENNRRRIQLLEQAARLVYKEWFVHLRFPGHEHVKITNGVPEGWKAACLSDIGNIVTGKTPSKKEESYFGPGIPFIKTPDMHGNVLVLETDESLTDDGAKTQRNKTLPPLSTMVSCIGTVGAVSMNATEAQTNQQINSIVPHSPRMTYWTFLMAGTLKPILEGMSGGVTMANVNKGKFSSVRVVIPTEQILEIFTANTKPLFDQIERLGRSNLRLCKARDLLLPRLMNGEIPV